MTGPTIDRYDWQGGSEAMLRFGPAAGPVVVAALPLFEEANRTRTFAVALLRLLADRGIASVLPDAPGQGESVASLTALTLPAIAHACAAITDRMTGEGRRTYALGIRSGALLDVDAQHAGRWHLSPQTGDDLLRDLHRVWRAAGHRGDPDAMMRGAHDVEIAGNSLPPALLRSFTAAVPLDRHDRSRRIVRLAGDPRAANRTIDAAPLWRRAEPGQDLALAATLADDIAGWIALCEA